MPDISIPLGHLKKPIEAVFSIATEKAKEEIARIKAEASLKTVYQKLNSTQKVKTIWDVDRARSLSSFYYPAKIRSESGARQQLTSLNELPSNAVVLSGTVGQGKSILLRHLLGKEMRGGERVPLFIELRKVPLSGLESYLRKMFNELLETNHPEIFGIFAKSGKISFLLDGFDEIDPDRAQDLMSSIESLATGYPSTRIIVTSRPNSGIETSPVFDVVHIAQLTEADYPGFFNKILSRERGLAEMITNAVLNSKSVREVASTPLLATLLTIVYRSTQRIPDDFSDFYDQLFQILLVRHDRSKAFSRKRKTQLGDREIQQAFEAFCFKVHASNTSLVPKIKALEYSKNALQQYELKCKEDYFLDDIIRVTCLLQEEGGNIEFLHQSVREFYAAKYVESRPEMVAKKFYAQLNTTGNWKKWDQVIKFLSQIDRYRISQFHLIPMARTFLTSVQSEHTRAAPPRLREFISDLGGIRRNKNKKKGDAQADFIAYRKYPNDSHYWDRFSNQIFQFFFIPVGGIASSRWREAFSDPAVEERSYTHIAAHCGKTKELDDFLTNFVTEVANELAALSASAKIIESSDQFMGI